MIKYIFCSSKIILFLISSSLYLRNIELVNKKARLIICITLIKKRILLLLLLLLLVSSHTIKIINAIFNKIMYKRRKEKRTQREEGRAQIISIGL